jgi:hypothetical protein
LVSAGGCIGKIVTHKVVEVVGSEKSFNHRVVSWGVRVKEKEDLVAVGFKGGDEVSEIIENLLAWVGVVNTLSA